MTDDQLALGIVGQLRLDYYVTSDGSSYEALLGGGALYASAGAAVWQGVRPHVIAAIPPGFPGASLEQLREHGIGTSYLIPTAEGDPNTFFAYDRQGARHSDRPTKHYLRTGRPLPKSLLAGLGPGAAGFKSIGHGSLPALQPDMLPTEMDRLAGIHIAASTLTEELILPPRLRELGIDFISLDPPTAYMSSDHLEGQRTAIHGLDAFIPSETQARLLFRPDSFTVWEMAEKLAEAGCREVIIKRGRDGQILFDSETGQRWIIPAYPTDAHDVTGAGHAFCGGFLAGMLISGDPLEACLMGNVSASFVIEGSGLAYALGAMPGLPRARLARLRASIRSSP